MKKKIIFSVILIALLAVVVGCGKKETVQTEAPIVGGWEMVLTDSKANVPEDAKKAFEDAMNGYVGMDFEVVALLGKQIVAGTNYMFLCKGTPVVQNPTTSYKVVVIYSDLEGKSKVLHVNDFEYADYVNKDNEYKDDENTGGWFTDYPSESVKLDDKAQNVFDNSAKKLLGISYSPIAVVAKQLVNGNNYAVVAYGKLSTKEDNVGIYLLTLNENTNGEAKVVSSSYIDLSEFNK